MNIAAALVVLPLIALAACDPPGPMVRGRISVSPDIRLEQFTTLELRFYPNDDGGFSTRQRAPLDEQVVESVDISTMKFPYDYGMGRVIGPTQRHAWRIVAWLAARNRKWPSVDAPMATRPVPIPPLSGVFLDGFGGVVAGVDLELAVPPVLSGNDL